VTRSGRPTALEKYDAMFAYERRCWMEGRVRVGGIDEAGRGPLAGPVVAACCILDPEDRILGLDDSKKLSPAKRERLFEEILARSLAFGIAEVDAGEIDRINILNATRRAMAEAFERLAVRPDILLVDAVALEGTGVPVLPIVKGDALSVSIAAASILAKVHRDRLMDAFDAAYPAYGFAKHKGYGTPEHCEAIRRHGLCPIHRRSFTRSLVDG
jgi:ribonuclease HII